METVKIYNAADVFEVDRVKELFRENNIECYVSEAGVGGYLAIQQGFSMYGKDIYVLKEDEDKAKVLIEKFKEEIEDELQDYYASFEDEDDIDDDCNKEKNVIKRNLEGNNVPWFKNRTIVARIIVIGGLIIGIITGIINNLQK